MSIMQLHEDTPIAPYVQFPIIEVDVSVLLTLGATKFDGDYTQQSMGKRFSIYLKNNINIYSALSSDCPRSALDAASIIKNTNDFVVIEGIYQRVDTTMELVTSEPSDFSISPHYYEQEIYQNRLVYKPAGKWYYSYKTYYKDISPNEKKMTRYFFTDTNLQFTVNVGTNVFRDKAYKFSCFAGLYGLTQGSYTADIPGYWGINSAVYNPYKDSSDIAYSYRFIIGECVNSDIIEPSTGWNTLDAEKPYSCFFVHTKYNDVDYYGVCYISLSTTNPETAVPTTIFCGFFSKEYWGSSIIEGGTVPTGQWGPVSGQSGGSGSWDNTDDSASINVPLPVASLPNALTVGGLHAYLMSEPMLDKLSGLMYNPTTFNNFWSKWLNQKFNPISGIISIHKLPFALQPTGTETFVRIAGAVLDATYMSDLGACLGDLISSQYTETPEYAVSLPEYFGSFYDYDPYTKCYLHLPACGIIKISANEILAGSVSVKYRCDIITGNVCAIVKTTDRNNVVKTHFVTGNCAYKMPFIGRDDGGVDNLVSLISGGISLLSGNVAGAIGAGKAIAEREHSTTITGDCTGNLTPLSDLKLWLEVVRVVPSTPENKQEMQGIPANVYTLLYSISGTGYAEIETIHLENIPDATNEEIAEIENILKNGAVF